MREVREKVGLADAKRMMEVYKDKFLCHFEYGDNHGDDVPTSMGTVLENSHEIWARVPTVRISNH
jgi:hypothetical protein